MTLIELCVCLDLATQLCRPEVRAWIDLEPEIGLDSELELPLQQRIGPEWVGVFALGKAEPQRFLYRLGLVAQPGVDWSLRVRHRGLQRDILVDGDTLATAKCWLVGSCCAPFTAGHRAVGTSRSQTVLTALQPGRARATEGESKPRVVVLDHYRPRG